MSLRSSLTLHSLPHKDRIQLRPQLPPRRYQTNKHNLTSAHSPQMTMPGTLGRHPYRRACLISLCLTYTRTHTGMDTTITTLTMLHHWLGMPAPIASGACACAFVRSVTCSPPVHPQYLHPGLISRP